MNQQRGKRMPGWRAHFVPDGWLGLHFIVGFLVVFIACVAFAEIAHRSGAHRPFALVDQTVVAWFHQHATPPLTRAALLVSFFGSVRWLSAASLITAAILWRNRMWNRMMVVLLAMAGGSLLNIALKHAFHRQRPVLENPLVTLSSFGFPSGHTMGATIFYGLIALLVAERAARWSLRGLAITAALFITILIATSRVYLGAHYVSDVAGAFAAGLGWLAFSYSGLEMLRRRRARNAR